MQRRLVMSFYTEQIRLRLNKSPLKDLHSHCQLLTPVIAVCDANARSLLRIHSAQRAAE